MKHATAARALALRGTGTKAICMSIVQASAKLHANPYGIAAADRALEATEEAKRTFARLKRCLGNNLIRADVHENGSLIVPVNGRLGRRLKMICGYDGTFVASIQKPNCPHTFVADNARNLKNPEHVARLKQLIWETLNLGAEDLVTTDLQRID